MAFFYGPGKRKVGVAVINERHATGDWGMGGTLQAPVPPASGNTLFFRIVGNPEVIRGSRVI
jgi:hypothetical protein